MISSINSPNSEISVIRTLLNRDARFWADSWSLLHEGLFVDTRLILIYRAVSELYNQNISPDITKVMTCLEVTDKSKLVDDEFVLQLIQGSEVFGSLTSHVKTLQDCFQRRETETVLTRSLYNVRDRKADISDLLDSTINSLVDVGATTSQTIIKPVVYYLDQMVDGITKRSQGIDDGCIKTNLIELDKKIDAIEPGNMVVIAGRPSSGKTTFLQYLAVDVLVNQNKPVVVVSGETKGASLMARMVSCYAGLNLKSLKRGNLDAHEWKKLTNAIQRLKDLPLSLFDDSSPTIAQINEVLRIAKNKYGYIGAIFVDYLQLCQIERNPRVDEDIVQKTTTVSRALKGMAMKYDCPIFVLSQLNRKSEERKDKYYLNSDLKGSSQIEQDADFIIFIHREEMYNKKDDSLIGLAELIVNKQRDGETGSAFVHADLAHSTFRNKDWGMQDD